MSAKYRGALPQLSDKLFLTDAGLETELVFIDRIDLPEFAAIDMLRTAGGVARMNAYYTSFIDLARKTRSGVVLETATWRASPDWVEKIGYSAEEGRALNEKSVKMIEQLRASYETDATPIVISGCIGPRGDGYDPGEIMSVQEAQEYHAQQIAILAKTNADLVTGMTITNTPEAIGFVRAARDAGMPVVISFTVETDGRLPTGQTLRDAIMETDDATGNAVAYYMINCAHPTHFDAVLQQGGDWLGRIRGLRANASSCSHEELDNSEVLDEGNPRELGAQYRSLRARHPQITVVGGCCGTDLRHVTAIAEACLKAA